MPPRLLGLVLATGLLLSPLVVHGETTKTPRTVARAASNTAAALEKETTPAPLPAAPVSTPPAAVETPPPPSSPKPAPAPSFLSPGGPLLLGSLVLVGLLYAATRVLRRLPIGRLLPTADGPIRISARTQLGARESLCLIDVGPTRLLVAITAQSIQTLHVWSDGGTGAGRPTATPPTTAVPGQLRELAARLTGTR
jgi:hypothetical protein